MRCQICDKLLEDSEIRDDPKQPGKLLPCGECLDQIYDKHGPKTVEDLVISITDIE